MRGYHPFQRLGGRKVTDSSTLMLPIVNSWKYSTTYLEDHFKDIQDQYHHLAKRYTIIIPYHDCILVSMLFTT